MGDDYEEQHNDVRCDRQMTDGMGPRLKGGQLNNFAHDAQTLLNSAQLCSNSAQSLWHVSVQVCFFSTYSASPLFPERLPNLIEPDHLILHPTSNTLV